MIEYVDICQSIIVNCPHCEHQNRVDDIFSLVSHEQNTNTELQIPIITCCKGCNKNFYTFFNLNIRVEGEYEKPTDDF